MNLRTMRNLAGRALIDVAALFLVALVAMAYLGTSKAPQLGIDGSYGRAYASLANGRIQMFSDTSHETILSDYFVTDPTVRPPVKSDRKFSAAGVHYRSVQWGDTAVWRLSVAAPLLIVVPAGLGVAIALVRRGRGSSAILPPVPGKKS